MYGESHHLDEALRKRITLSSVREEFRRALQHETLTPFERLMMLGMHTLLDHQNQLADRFFTLETKASQALRVIADEHDDNRGVGGW